MCVVRVISLVLAVSCISAAPVGNSPMRRSVPYPVESQPFRPTALQLGYPGQRHQRNVAFLNVGQRDGRLREPDNAKEIGRRGPPFPQPYFSNSHAIVPNYFVMNPVKNEPDFISISEDKQNQGKTITQSNITSIGYANMTEAERNQTLRQEHMKWKKEMLGEGSRAVDQKYYPVQENIVIPLNGSQLSADNSPTIPAPPNELIKVVVSKNQPAIVVEKTNKFPSSLNKSTDLPTEETIMASTNNEENNKQKSISKTSNAKNSRFLVLNNTIINPKEISLKPNEIPVRLTLKDKDGKKIVVTAIYSPNKKKPSTVNNDNIALVSVNENATVRPIGELIADSTSKSTVITSTQKSALNIPASSSTIPRKTVTFQESVKEISTSKAPQYVLSPLTTTTISDQNVTPRTTVTILSTRRTPKNEFILPTSNPIIKASLSPIELAIASSYTSTTTPRNILLDLLKSVQNSVPESPASIGVPLSNANVGAINDDRSSNLTTLLEQVNNALERSNSIDNSPSGANNPLENISEVPPFLKDIITQIDDQLAVLLRDTVKKYVSAPDSNAPQTMTKLVESTTKVHSYFRPITSRNIPRTTIATTTVSPTFLDQIQLQPILDALTKEISGGAERIRKELSYVAEDSADSIIKTVGLASDRVSDVTATSYRGALQTRDAMTKLLRKSVENIGNFVSQAVQDTVKTAYGTAQSVGQFIHDLNVNAMDGILNRGTSVRNLFSDTISDMGQATNRTVQVLNRVMARNTRTMLEK